MIQNLSCKFCHKPISVAVDDSYEGDPYKLFPLAACDRCADLRVRRRVLSEKIARVLFNFNGYVKTEERIEQTRKTLTKLTKRYVRMVADWMGVPGLPWEESIVDAMVKDPDQMGPCLGRIWDAAKHTQRLI